LNGTQGYRDTIYLTYLADFVNSGGNPSAVWTPALEYDTTYTVDTLAVDLVDMSGAFVDEAPELSVTIDINGALESIIFEEDASTGLFNIEAALTAATNFDSWTAVLTNRERKASKISGDDTNRAYRIGHSDEDVAVSIYYGVYYSGAYNGYATSQKPKGAASGGNGADADAYFPAGTWESWDWTPTDRPRP
jgi:hypothetical protein